jgi:uncharacterized protein YkwD
MIAPSHNGFVERSENIIAVTGCKSVVKMLHIIKTPQSTLDAWLKSVKQENIEGNFTHLGLSIREDSTGRKYYTNIFIF